MAKHTTPRTGPRRCPWCLNPMRQGEQTTSHTTHRAGRAGRHTVTITGHAPGTCPPGKL